MCNMLLLPPCIRPLGFGVLGRRKEEGKEREGSFYICARFSALINGMKLGEEEGGNEEEKCGEKQRTKQSAVKADRGPDMGETSLRLRMVHCHRVYGAWLIGVPQVGQVW